MLQRIFTGAFIAIVIIAVLFSTPLVVSAFVTFMIIAAQYEMSKVIGLNDKKVLLWLNVISSAVFSLLVWFKCGSCIPAVFAAYVVILFAIQLFDHERVGFSHISLSVFSIVYITASMLHIIAVRNMEFGGLNIFMIFIGAFATDTCAYFVGVLFGKHKLCEKVSPKKTIEGAIGGEVGNILLMLAFGYVTSIIADVNVNYVNLLILGVLSGLVSQLGDLTASIIKREYNVKDYGNLLPGHGGVMDRIDSIIMMAPLVYYFVSYLPVFVK